MAASRLAKISYWGVGILAALLITVSILVSFLDWNQYRSTLADLASNQMDMRVDLAGNVTVSLFPRPSVAAETVRIAPIGQGNSEVIATADKISMRLGFASALKGEIAVQSLSLEGLSVALDQAADGAWSVRGWPKSAGTTENNIIELARLDIESGTIELVPYEGDVRQLDGVNLHLSGTLPKGPLEWQGEFRHRGLQVQTNGRLKPVTVRDEVSLKAEVTVAQSTIAVSGRLADNGDLTARILIEGEEAGTTSRAISAMVVGEGQQTRLPNIPFRLDAQLDVNGGITRFVSRQLSLADTRGRLDLTIAQKAGMHHLAGVLALGVIDADAWQSAMPAKPEATPAVSVIGAQDTAQSRLVGAVDVTIEGVRMTSGLGQSIDAVVAFRPEGPKLTNLQALLPGAASVSLVGEMGADGGDAAILLEVGNVSDLMSWAGVALPDAVPTGRLSTAKAKATLGYQDGSWSFTNIEGNLDTTLVTGEMSGTLGRLVPSHVKLALDKLDLDIFSDSDHGADQTFLQIPEGHDFAFDLSASELFGFDANLGKTRAVGALRNGRLELDYLSVESGNAALKLEGTLANRDDDVELELTAEFQDWPMSVSRHFVGELQEYMIAADMPQVSGTASAAGTLSRMRLGLDAASQGKEINLSGEIGFPQGRLTFVALQGGLKHDNLAGIVRRSSGQDFKSLPAQLTYSLEKPGPGLPFDVRLGGDLAGGKVQAAMQMITGLEQLSFTYDHENVGRFLSAIGRSIGGVDVAEGLRSEASIRKTDNSWQVEIPGIKNGERALSGQIAVDEAGTFSGELSVASIDFGAIGGNEPSGTFDFDALLDQLDGRTGTLNLALSNVSVAGQSISAPSASLSVEAEKATLSLGETAELNGRPAKLSAEARLTEGMPFSLTTDVEALELGSIMASEGLADVINSTLKGQMTLEGSLNAPASVISGLSGNGSFEGSAGQLKFLSVAALVSDMQSATSGRSFLADVGGLLRSGETGFASLKSNFTLDGGVMLLETMEASGDWGSFTLDGQINLADRFLAVKGGLALSNPPDTPMIPVSYDGSFDGPQANWSSRLFERFVLAGIERRLRGRLFQEAEARQANSGQLTESPGIAVFSRALGLLSQLRDKQLEEKRRAEEARRKAEELKRAADAAQGTEEQTPE